jgi:hypothetical protein
VVVLLAGILMRLALAAEPALAPGWEPAPDLGPPLAGEVGEGVARFRIPMQPARDYRWWVPIDGEPLLEYGWVIELRNNGETLRFGFALWNTGDQPEAMGDLHALVAAGETGVWRVLGDGETEPLPELVIALEPHEAHLEIVITDEATRTALFSDGPMLFRIIETRNYVFQPDQRFSKEIVRTAHLVYQGNAAAPPVAPPPKGR